MMNYNELNINSFYEIAKSFSEEKYARLYYISK